MTLRERIAEHLAAQPEGKFCQVCLQRKLGLATAHGMNRTTLLLAHLGYKRGQGVCTVCGETRKVIRHMG